MVHRPEREIARERADDRAARLDGRVAKHARGEPEPQQRQCQCIRQQLRVEVDERERDQEPGEYERRAQLRPKAELPRDRRGEDPRQQLDAGIARADLRLATRALAAQREPAEHRHIVDRPDRRLAGRAGRARCHDAERRLGRLASREFVALPSPLPIQDDRRAIDHDVQEAADQQPQNEASRNHTTAPSLKIGRYIAITRPPTSTPRIAMISGSSRLDMLSTALSTSAS